LTPGNVHTVVDALYRQYFGTLLNRLLQLLPALELEEAEDILQDVFATALTNWQDKQIPFNPAGWLYVAAKNKAINLLKNKNRFTAEIKEHILITEEDVPGDAAIAGLTLGMLFACAHPDLAPKTQMILTLKYVMNLKVEAIAKAFAMTVDGVDKILVRARQKIRSENIRLTVPRQVQQRLPVVNKIIYLIFNEGYKASYGFELLREELCEEALLLCKELLDAAIGDNDSKALYALMLFNSARFKARFSQDGKLVDLENQNRGLWNKELIKLGSHYLAGARSGPATPFKIEAAIAWLHCAAPAFEQTRWGLIAALYARLLRINANPFLQLNYAVALFYAGDKQNAFVQVNQLRQQPFFNQYYLLNTTLGRFYLAEGNKMAAREFFLKAIGQTNFEAEKQFIKQLLACTG
jgi:RNA polymerase sigma-70 factor (ECF subfamily)